MQTYPPTTGLEKLKQVQATSDVPPPPGLEKLKQVGVTSDVPPPPGMEKLKSQVSVTFWFWLMLAEGCHWHLLPRQNFTTSFVLAKDANGNLQPTIYNHICV